jgi:hypothetical protein
MSDLRRFNARQNGSPEAFEPPDLCCANGKEQKDAREFARGHRGIPVREPVVASALIPKDHIFFVSDERQEKEVVLNPRRLREVIIEPFEGVPLLAAIILRVLLWVTLSW